MDNKINHFKFKVRSHLPDILYFISSMLFFYTQLHIVIEYLMFSKINFVEIWLCLILFKIGELIHEFIDIEYNDIFSILIIIISIGLIKFSTIPIFYFFFSFIFMKIRSNISEYSSKKVKIIGRAIGFILSPFYNSLIYLLCVILTSVICLLTTELETTKRLKINKINNKENSIIYLLMALHHTHYFVYAYSIPIFFFQKNILPIEITGLIFYLGWAAYNAYEKIIKPAWNWFIIGHILAAFSLIILYMTNVLFFTIIAWFMTGLGGGTVYMLHSLVYKKNNNTKKDMLIAEGFGHLIGIILWGIIYLLKGVNANFLFGAFFAIIIAILSYYTNYKTNLISSRF
ncbi:hypothetical protein XO10_01390 [Marinitoga sp. 1135]|uniref:hypothetical protein n=1 Tax=unclassified Marinitoga TaxID=2640159 RepID=UPI00095080C8|nr:MULTISPECIES: hypothetical protein [unclassified Marinitoga]APT75183.1 hypothetical protein LN42_01305 [Marinitoga sp. 1137]NUU94957.1 hypothetical protein [Marinitoga sp. 1135]NUU96926.1 hypothetical protein [Marinitoga sp. 1138]